MRRIEYYRPRTLDEAWDLAEKIAQSRFVAGGTDLLVKMRDGKTRPRAMISLRSIGELQGIEEQGSIRIGAMSTISGVMESPIVREKLPLLVKAAENLGSVQIRNAATIGGNLCNCSPCADTALPLLIFEARVRLRAPGRTREVSIEEFFLGPGKSCLNEGEILTDIIVDPPASKTGGTFLKKTRVKMDLAIASLAVMAAAEEHHLKRFKIAAGSVAPTPLRLHKVEGFLEGTRLNPDNINQAGELAAKEISPISDIRAGAEYRRLIISVYLRRALKELSNGSM